MSRAFERPPSERFDWSEENVERMTAFWKDGDSAGVIAGKLGTTRNTVIGKVQRLKLGKHSIEDRKPVGGSGWQPHQKHRVSASPKNTKPTRHRSNATKAKDMTAKRDIALRTRAGAVGRIMQAEPEFAEDRSALTGGAWDPLPGSSPIPLIDLPLRGLCRWPIGENSPYLSCALPVDASHVYCAVHQRRHKPAVTR